MSVRALARVCCTAMLRGAFRACAIAAPAALPAQQTMPVADLRWSVLTLSGELRTLGSLRGRVIVINSWATWCEPCVAELGSLVALRQAIPDSALSFALIAPQRREPVLEFVRRRGLTLPVYLEASPAPAVYGFNAVPTTWIVDRAGRIVMRQRGARRWDTPATITLIRSLLADTARVATGPKQVPTGDVR